MLALLKVCSRLSTLLSHLQLVVGIVQQNYTIYIFYQFTFFKSLVNKNVDLRSLWGGGVGGGGRTCRIPLPYGPVFGYTSAFTVFTEFKLLSTLVICKIVYSDSNDLSNLSRTEVN